MIVVVFLGGAAIAVMLLGIRNLRGSTLVAPLGWSIAATVIVVLTEVVVGVGWGQLGADVIAPLRFVAVVGTLCPVVALLGAKRPQSGPWQLIVLSLWGILALPALDATVLRPSATVQLHWMRNGFHALLIALGPLNYLATSRRWSAMLIACGQCCLMWGGASDWFVSPGWDPVKTGLAFIVIGALLACKKPRSALLRERSLVGLWYSFRECYGAAWGLRIVERMNTAGIVAGAAVRWSWRGPVFVGPDQSTEAGAVAASAATLLSMLRRFVPDSWIQQYVVDSEIPRKLQEHDSTSASKI